MKRTAINPVRKTPRKGEPTKAEKAAAREHCFYRAGGMCELQLVAECWGFAQQEGDPGDPMTHGHLCHALSKRRFGWHETVIAPGVTVQTPVQRHLWGCPPCHAASHNAGGKPVPRK